MDFDYQILRLTKDFYSAYADHNIYGELMLKENRAYNCLLIDLYYDYFLCIPYRTDIRHKNAFKFRKSSRSRTHQSGLDYSKMVIVKNSEYLEAKDAIIDHDVQIDVHTAMGGVEIFVPSNVNVVVKSNSFMGGVGNDTRRNPADSRCINVRVSNFMGGVTIRN